MIHTQISASLTSRFLPKGGGQEWLRASIGQIFYLKDRRVSLCEELGDRNECLLFEDQKAQAHHSNLIATTTFNPTENVSSGLFWEWDTTHLKTEQASMNIHYQPSAQKIISANYYWQQRDLAQTDLTTGTSGSLHQADFSFLWPITLHWQGLARWHYDLKQQKTLEVLGGIEYNGCCAALQLVGSRYRQSHTDLVPRTYATGVFAQVVLKGLTSMGNSDGKLKQKIPGYTPLSQRQKSLTMKPNYK